MTFVTHMVVRFAHVDGAGIVFYPRYFEMLNAALEDFFADVVGLDFRTMHMDRGIGVPTVKLESEFVAPSRLGDMLDIAVSVRHCGRTSAAMSFDVSCGGEARMKTASVIVCMDLKAARAVPWPEQVRLRLEPMPQRASYADGATDRSHQPNRHGGMGMPAEEADRPLLPKAPSSDAAHPAGEFRKGGKLSPSDGSPADETPENMVPGTLDARG